MSSVTSNGSGCFVIPFEKTTSAEPIKEFTETPIPNQLTEKISGIAKGLSSKWRNAFFQGQFTDVDEPTRGSIFLTRCIKEEGDLPPQLQSQTELIVAQFLAAHTLGHYSITKLPYGREVDSRKNVKEDLKATDEQMEEGVLLLACGAAVELVPILREQAPEFLQSLKSSYNGRWQLSE